MTAPNGAVKVLIAGDVKGNIDVLFKRASAVNTSNGPFHLLLCVGPFFNPSGDDDAEFVGELAPYINGVKTAPLPTYFIGGYGLGSRSALSTLATAPSSGIRYLGSSGIVTIRGLQIAFLDGTFNGVAFRAQKPSGQSHVCRHYTAEDIEALKSAVAQAEGDVDILLTNEWPSMVCSNVPEATGPVGGPPMGSTHCMEVAIAVRPRYHFAGGQHIFYTRPPYMNVDLGAGKHATRFISLGDVANEKKQKWLHALALESASRMDPDILTAAPPGATNSPYMRAGTAKRNAPEVESDIGEQTWRWQDRSKRPRAPIAAPSLGRSDIERDRSKTVFVRNVPFQANEDDIVAFFSQAGEVEDVVRKTNQEGKLNTFCHVQFVTRDAMERACQLTGSDFMGRQLHIEPAAMEEGGRRRAAGMAAPVENCWFCLSNPNADTALVVSVGDDAYIALDKGPISDFHALVLPVEHYACLLDASKGARAEVSRYISALRSCFASQGKELVGFERFMRLRKSGGNHCHVNVIAVSPAAAQQARAKFESTAARHGFTLSHVPDGDNSDDSIKAVVRDGEYFIALLPDGSHLVHPIAYGERHPLNFGREVLAELAGAPGRADWKACQSTPAEEEARTAAFRSAFAPYDIMLQGPE